MPDLSEAKTRITNLASDLKSRKEPTRASAPLPIRANPQKVVKAWDRTKSREAMLEGIPVKEAILRRGDDQGSWGTTFIIDLELTETLPDVATKELAGKTIRRLKALVETGEIPTTDMNPSYRADAGEGDS